MASSPLIVEDRLSPSNLVVPRLRTGSDDGTHAATGMFGRRDRASRSAVPPAQLATPPKAGRKNSSGQVRNDGRGQVESHLGRNRLTSDAPYKAMLWLRKGFGFAGAWTVCEQNRLLALCFGLHRLT